MAQDALHAEEADSHIWKSEKELIKLKDKKHKLEEAEPYNTPGARKRAKTVGMEEAQRSNASDGSRA